MLTELIQKVLNNYQAKGREKSITIGKLVIHTPNAWDFRISFDFGDRGQLTIRNITDNDLANLKQFKNQLSKRSCELIPCYPWDNEQKLESALKQAIKKTEQKIDAAYIIENQNQPIGHFFLWKAGGNPHSLRYGLDIPELGVAIADEFHGLGLGSLSVRLLQAIAQSLQRDAIELTTAKSNDAGWNTYLSSGFQYTGDIDNPLDVDVTEAFLGQALAPRSRIERQMVYIIRQDKMPTILGYLAAKREEAKNSFRQKTEVA